MIFNIVNSLLTIIPLAIITWVLILLGKETFKKIPKSNYVLAICFIGIWLIVLWMLEREFSATESEITVSWFSILNSFFIIAFASAFSKWWDSKYNPSAAVVWAWTYHYGCRFWFLSLWFNGIEVGVKVSMIWLVLAYLFHTLGFSTVLCV